MREELNRLMKEYELSKGDVCRIICEETHKSCSVRAVRSWLADPVKAYAKPCPEWVVDTIKIYFDNNKYSIAEASCAYNQIIQGDKKWELVTVISTFIFSLVITGLFSAMITYAVLSNKGIDDFNDRTPPYEISGFMDD